jgi:hypothetical protein
MDGLDTMRLVLVRSIVKNSTGEETYVYGTGYFVTRELVLTANHVVCSNPYAVEVRPEAQLDGQPPWLQAEPVPVWMNQQLDAALLKVVKPIQEVELPRWPKTVFAHNVEWHSAAYPHAASQKTEDGRAYKSAGLKGTFIGKNLRGLRKLDYVLMRKAGLKTQL